MPHRRGLGDKAMDQRAETELGRLVLRGELSAVEGLAGETYLALWRGYVLSIAGPQAFDHSGGHGFTCDGCDTLEKQKFCRCFFRRKIYEEATTVLEREGMPILIAVRLTAVHDLAAPDLDLLRLGLDTLAEHFCLTRPQTVVVRKTGSESTPSPA